MKKIVRELAIMFMAFAVTFTSLPMMTGDFSVHAATAKKPAKVTGVKKKDAGTNYVTVKWNRIKKNKNTKGYTIYRNGSSVASVGKNVLYYKVDGLSQNTSYTFQVRAYNTYKQKQYYNSKSKKWVTKKPKSKYWKKCPSGKYVGKKTITVTKYKYGAASSGVTIKTARAAVVTAASMAPSSGNTSTGPASTNSNTVKVVNYKGEVTYVTPLGNGYLSCRKEGSTQETIKKETDSAWASMDKTRNGTFGEYKQQSGATFRMTGGGTNYTEGSINSPKITGSGDYYFTAYNVTPSKLKVALADTNTSLEDVNTYYWDTSQQKVVSYTATYVKKAGKRIALARDNSGNLSRVSGNTLTCCFYSVNGNNMLGTGLGIFNDSFKVSIQYDGVAIGTMTINSCNEQLASNGMSPTRRMYYAIAEDAINGNSTGTILGDKNIISQWIRTNIKHGQSYTTPYGTISSFGCQVSSGVLETWLIYNYGSPAYGFCRGSKGLDRDHIDYCLNSDPDSPFGVTYK